MANITSDEKYVTWEGLAVNGLSFWDTYNLITEQTAAVYYPANYYLLSHCLELLIKSELRRRGYKLKKLRSFSHDLTKSVKEVTRQGFMKLNKKDIDIIDKINEYYVAKEFEYHGRMGIGLPNLSEFRDIVLKVGKQCQIDPKAFNAN